MATTPCPPLEIVRPEAFPTRIRHALFDFDGTLSLIRQGWQQVMAPMMVEYLMATPQHEPREVVERLVAEMIDETTGKQTIYQMMALEEMIRERGGEARDAAAYKRDYLDRLWERIEGRVAGLEQGRIEPHSLRVSGAMAFLQALRERNITCYLASGTDVGYVRNEVRALGLDGFFGAHVYGALEDWQSYSKAMVIERILRENRLQGAELATFGDGFVEIENCVAVGGIAVGVASDEEQRHRVDAWKRERLIRAGAHVILADFCRADEILALLGWE